MIPNIIHYIWIDKSDNDFGMLPYVYELCVASCIKHNSRDFKIVMHSNKPMRYRFIKDIKEDIIDSSIMGEMNFIGISRVAHMSDFIRYKILKDVGGLYIDTDILVLRNLSFLLDNEFVIAKQSRAMCCNGFLAVRPNHELISETFQSYYDDYHGDKWAYNSMRIISDNISSGNIDGLTVLDITEGFHYPLYTNMSKIYEPYTHDFDNVLGHHLWSSSPEGKKLIKYIEDNIHNEHESNYILRQCRYILNKE